MSKDIDTVTLPFSSNAEDTIFLSRVNHDCQVIRDLIKENIIVNEHLHRSIELLNSTLITYSSNNAFDLKAIIPIVSVIIGAFIGFLLNQYHWKRTEKEKKKASSFSKIFNLISELESLSVDYWIKDTSEDDVKTEVYIKSKIRLLTSYVKSVDANQIVLKNELINFTSEIFDLVTGDEFESKARKASKSKATSISYRCADINAVVANHY